MMCVVQVFHVNPISFWCRIQDGYRPLHLMVFCVFFGSQVQHQSQFSSTWLRPHLAVETLSTLSSHMLNLQVTSMSSRYVNHPKKRVCFHISWYNPLKPIMHLLLYFFPNILKCDISRVLDILENKYCSWVAQGGRRKQPELLLFGRKFWQY